MPLTFEIALAKIKKTEVMVDYWEGWPFYVDNKTNLSPGMLPLFLCDRHQEIKKEIGDRAFYVLLKEMAAFAKEAGPQSLVITPNRGKPNRTPRSPLWEAIVSHDSKAISILLDYTPTEGVNRRIPELAIGEMAVHYMLPRAIYGEIDTTVIYTLLRKTTSIEALTEALQQTNGKQQGYDGGRKYGSKGVAEMHRRIQKRIDEVNNPEAARSWGASFVSLFTGSRSKPVAPSAASVAKPQGISA